MLRFPRPRSTSALVAIASFTAIALLVPASASAEPIGSIQTVSTYAPTATISACGSAATATNPTSGATVAVFAAATAAVSASVNITLIGAGAVPGATVTHQPSDTRAVGGPGSCNPVSVDAGANGGFLVSWTNEDSVFGLVVNSSGAVVGTEFLLSGNTNYNDIETATAAWSQTDTRYLVTWKARVNTPFPAALNSQQIVGRFIDAAGAPLGADFLVTNVTQGIDNSQDVVYGAGTWIAVGVALDNVVRAVTIAPNGTIGAATLVPAPAGSSRGVSIDFNTATGQFFIVSRAGSSVWGQLVTPTGALVAPSFAVATSAGSRPRLTSLGADGWMVIWHIPGGPGGATDVLGIEVTAAGAPVGTPTVVSGGFGNSSIESNFRPEVSFSAATGEATVVWTRFVAAPTATTVVARAWAVTAPAAVAPVAAPAAVPTLPLTGVDSDRTALAGAAGALALLAGAAALVARRRRTAGTVV